MNKLVTLISGILVLLPLAGQDPDAISGATLKPEYLQQYLSDPLVRRVYNNDNFDSQPYFELKITLPEVGGEVINPGTLSFDGLRERTVFVKELLPSEETPGYKFIGAFAYTGYSLSDLIKDVVVDKRNKTEFGLSLDLYVVVSNSKGESAVFSWGELFFSKSGQDIILATGVTPVFPSAADERWEVPSVSKIVAANDFFSLRNIQEPETITILSFPVSLPGTKGTLPIYSPDLKITFRDQTATVDSFEGVESSLRLSTVFFGLHKGLRHVSVFKGVSLGEVLDEKFEISNSDIQHGLLAVSAVDGYRVVYSLAEIANRTDMEEVMLIDLGNDEDGRFVIFPGSDFFADRYLKGAKTGHMLNTSDMKSGLIR